MNRFVFLLVLLAGCSGRSFGSGASKEATDALLNQARASIAAGDTHAALDHLNNLLAQDPDHGDALTMRAELYQQSGEYKKAIADYDQAILQSPGSAKAARSLGWLLATCPDDSVRDGQRAVQAAQIAVLRGHDDWHNLDTLAAAMAEAGDFDGAVKYQTALLQHAPPDHVAELQQRLDSYRRGQPWRAN